MVAAPFDSFTDLEALVREFEATTLLQRDWNHRAHLSVAAWYLLHHDYEDATARVRTGIRRYNRAQGIAVSPMGGYHETLTLFWLEIVRGFLKEQTSAKTLEQVNRLIAAFAQRKTLFLEYYSPECLWSDEARKTWVAPDLKPLSRRLD